MRTERIYGACLAVAVGLTYAAGLSGAWVYDDLPTIRDNPGLGRLWPLLPAVGTTESGRPLLHLSFVLNHAISGTAAWSYHALNLLIHAAAALVLFGIVRRTTSMTVAFGAALLWALHPLQTESVQYVVQRAESLMGLFYLVTLYCFLRGWRLRCWLACLCGMLTKEVMVSAPLMVLLYDGVFVAGSFRAAWARRRAFYLALSCTWILLAGLVSAAGWNRGGTTGVAGGITWASYLGTQFGAIARYLRLSFWPQGLVFDYGPIRTGSLAGIVPALLLVLALIGAIAWAWKRHRRLAFLGIFFFAILAPTSLVPGSLQMIAEHRMYLALAPLAVAMACLADATLGRRGPILCFTAAAALAVITAQRERDYRSSLALWADTVAKRPDNARARNNLGEEERQRGLQRAALDQFRTAVSLDPAFPEARFNLGGALLQQGQLAEGTEQLNEAVRLRPDFLEAHYVLAGALLQAGSVAPALAQYEQALRLRPDSFEARYNYGNALFTLGRVSQAADQYQRALALRPQSFEARYNAANAFVRLGQLDAAVSQFRQALAIRPDSADAHFNLGDALARAGRTHEAVQEFFAVLRLQPGSEDARARIAALGGAQGPASP